MVKVILLTSLLFSDVKDGESPSTKELRRAAFALIRQDRYAEAVPVLKRAADHGDRLALYQLGVMYEVGKAVPQDYTQAWECYCKSANQGLLAANHKIGLFYFYGWYIHKSEQKAVKVWLVGANRGFAPSQYLCATTWLSLHSQDTTAKNVEALRWLLKAARQNLPEAKCVLGVLYEVGFGVNKNLRLASDLERTTLEENFEIEPNMKAVAKTVFDRISKKLPSERS